MSAAALTSQRDRLQRLAVDVDQQLAAVEAALRIYHLQPGRPRLPLTMTVAEARRARIAYRAGDHSEWAVRGRREYERLMKRRERG